MLGTLSQPLAPPLILKKLPFLPYSFPNSSSLSLSSWGPTGFSLFAQKSEKISTFDEIIMEKGEDFEDIEDKFEFDEDEYDFDDEEDDFDDEDEEEDDELMVPFDKMNAWLEKRPKGFGEGKVYDTSLEDKLLEEIEQSLKAQIANVNKLKKERKMLTSNNKMQDELFKESRLNSRDVDDDDFEHLVAHAMSCTLESGAERSVECGGLRFGSLDEVVDDDELRSLEQGMKGVHGGMDRACFEAAAGAGDPRSTHRAKLLESSLIRTSRQ